jgi:hypothetical protein
MHHHERSVDQNRYVENINKTEPAMKKGRKQQADRLLKRLPLKDRRLQEQLRRQILSDTIFQTI